MAGVTDEAAGRWPEAADAAAGMPAAASAGRGCRAPPPAGRDPAAAVLPPGPGAPFGARAAV